MKLHPVVLDFESLPIESRPHYPPEPVSFSLKMPTWRAPKFYAWGHRTGGNNTSAEDAKRVLTAAYAAVTPTTPLLCHNGKFDMDVAEEWFGLPLPDWRAFHDTMILLFLKDPHQHQLGLKPSAERLLGLPPEEQDAVKAWILQHKKTLEQEFPEIVTRYGGIKPSTAGAFVAYAPGNLVRPYADGDDTRTLQLFEALLPEITERGMLPAYHRELQLLPILLRNEREGIRVDSPALERDQAVYEAAQAKTDAWLRKALKAPGLDLDKDKDVAAALKAADAISVWTQTPTGRDSVSRKNMKLEHFRDRKVAAAYGYRQKCATTLETFIRPWRKFTVEGRMHTNWNQVRQTKGGGGDTGGTRTGRPSTDKPNFLNMPRTVEDNADTGFIMPTHIAGLPLLPRIRSYILPDEKGHVVGRRDFSQQELRVLAHFEDGALLAAYLNNPYLDVHHFLMVAIQEQFGLNVDRYTTKTLNFGYIYGQGMGSLAEKMGRPVDEVKQFRDAQMRALPGLKTLSDALKARARAGEPICTWGGRQYYVEPPMVIDGRLRTFEYKLINYLVQGSSADLTKESIIRYDAARKEGRFMLSVYDENDISVPKRALKAEMAILRECMLSMNTDVPLLSDGEWGVNLGTLQDFKEPKPDLTRWGITS